MNAIQLYDIGGDDDHTPYPHSEGDWCKATDVDALLEENKRLTEQVEFLQAQSDELAGHLDNARSTQLQLMEENKRLTERIADIKDDKFTYCAYCGEEFPIDVGGDVIDDHIKTCEKHPIAVYKAENQRLQAEEQFGREENARLSDAAIDTAKEIKCLRAALDEIGDYGCMLTGEDASDMAQIARAALAANCTHFCTSGDSL